MSHAQVAPAETLYVPTRALVVVAGIPGAGKTTLLRRWMTTGVPGTTVLDSEQVRSRAPGWVPYRLLRPVVHLVHWMRIALAVQSRTGLVVAHAPWPGTQTGGRCCGELPAPDRCRDSTSSGW